MTVPSQQWRRSLPRSCEKSDEAYYSGFSSAIKNSKSQSQVMRIKYLSDAMGFQPRAYLHMTDDLKMYFAMCRNKFDSIYIAFYQFSRHVWTAVIVLQPSRKEDSRFSWVIGLSLAGYGLATPARHTSLSAGIYLQRRLNTEQPRKLNHFALR